MLTLKTLRDDPQWVVSRLKVKNFDADVWSAKCRAVVYKGNLAKFTQNEDLKKYLKR